jgi:hypothetical protein
MKIFLLKDKENNSRQVIATTYVEINKVRACSLTAPTVQ